MLIRHKLLAAVGLALMSSGALFSGCKVNVLLGFECTTEDGQTVQAGDTFQQACNTCTCLGDGEFSCTEEACPGCEHNGQFHEVGDSFDAGDNCNTCDCLATGEVACTLLACPGCEGDPPLCAQKDDEPGGGQGCWYEPVCDETGNWNCVYSCECEGAPIPDCPAPPPGCFYNGPVCIDGSWSCGDLICDGMCEEPAPKCLQPPDPGCFAEPVCTEMGWQCEIFCQPVCEDPEPACPPDSFPECTDQGWTCTPFNMTCDEMGADCPPPVDPFCSNYALCTAEGSWYCQEDCPPEYCMEEPPGCPVGGPNCGSYAVCTSDGAWECAESCF